MLRSYQNIEFIGTSANLQNIVAEVAIQIVV